MFKKPLAAVTAVFALCASNAVLAQPPVRPAGLNASASGPPPSAVSATQTLTGRVERLLVNPNGDVDGLLIDDGTQISFPPHLSPAIVQAVRPGDSISVDGPRNPSVAVIRAQRITNTTTSRSVMDTPPAPGAPPPATPQALQALSVSGRITLLLHTDPGDVNGVLLDDGTSIRFPPLQGRQIAALLGPGLPLYAFGYGTRNALGTSIESTTIGRSRETAQPVFGLTGPGLAPGPGPKLPLPPAP